MEKQSEKRMLTVGEFCESFPPLMDGVGNVIKNYTEQLRERGHAAYAVTAGTKEGLAYDIEHGIKYTLRCNMYPLPGIKPYGLVVKNPRFKHELSHIPFDLVHAHSPFFHGKMATNIAKKRNIPLVSTFHTQFKADILGVVKSEKIASAITSFILKHYEAADQVWTPSEWSKKRLYEYGFRKEVIVVENGCDMELPSPSSLDSYHESGRHLAGVPKNTPILIYVGQHKDEKNLQLTLDSLRMLAARKVDYKMIFVGTGADKDRYEAYVKQHNLQNSIVFLGRITDREQIKALYSVSSLFLFPSKYDTSALVMREAAAFNLPLLYVQGSCTSESISHGVNGFIAEDNPQAYSGMIEWVLTHKEAQQAAGDGCRTSLYRHWRDAVDEVEQRYRELVDRHSK